MPGPGTRVGVVLALSSLEARLIEALDFKEKRRRAPATGVVALARIAGVNIPTNKRVVIRLQYIHGSARRRRRRSWTRSASRQSAGCRN